MRGIWLTIRVDRSVPHLLLPERLSKPLNPVAIPLAELKSNVRPLVSWTKHCGDWVKRSCENEEQMSQQMRGAQTMHVMRSYSHPRLQIPTPSPLCAILPARDQILCKGEKQLEVERKKFTKLTSLRDGSHELTVITQIENYIWFIVMRKARYGARTLLSATTTQLSRNYSFQTTTPTDTFQTLKVKSKCMTARLRLCLKHCHSLPQRWPSERCRALPLHRARLFATLLQTLHFL